MRGWQLERRALVMGLGGWWLAAAMPTPGRAWDQWPVPVLPSMPGLRPLNADVLDIIRTYRFGGEHPYVWVPGTHTDGTTRALQFQGVSVAQPSNDHGVHCSGITFEVWLRALERVGVPKWLSPDDVLSLKHTWYIRDGARLGPVEALSSRKLGVRIDRPDDLQPGDFVQFWRNSGKGHSAVFIAPRRRRDGSVRGLAFWSAQSASSGIGIRYASIGPGEHQLASLHGVRPVSPVA